MEPSGPPARPYLDALTAALERARAANVESLPAAAKIIEAVVAGDGIVYAFGSGHSQLTALELSRRAGGLAPLQVITDPTWGGAEDLEGYGETLISDTPLELHDCLIAISRSGATFAAIEIARRARAAGAKVIAVTSVAASKRATARHSSGQKLYEIADVVLDDGADGPDPGIEIPGLGLPVGPTSTVVATALIQEAIVEAIAGLAARGVDAPVYRPNSQPGGREHNEQLRARYRRRINKVP
jgi:uncharacterized phosphosugar-binding protein